MDEFTQEEGMRRLEEAAQRYARYPQGQPHEVTVTLSDEQWNAVAFAVEGMLIANRTEDSSIAPPWIDAQWVEAITAIRVAVHATIKPLAEASLKRGAEELLTEIEKELRNDG